MSWTLLQKLISTLLFLYPPIAFEDAKKNAPAIIFIDELDVIAPKEKVVRNN